MRLSKSGIRFSLFAAIALGMMLGAPTPAQDAGKETVQELVTLFSAWHDNRGHKPIFAAAARHIDYATMAELAFTPGQWDSFTPAQKHELIVSFQKLVEERYYMRWHKLFLRSRLAIASEAKAGGDTYVRTFLTHGKDEDTVIWRLRMRNGDPMVVSLDVNGKDLVSRLADRFQHQLKKRGPDGLVAWIKQLAESGTEEADESSAANQRTLSEH